MQRRNFLTRSAGHLALTCAAAPFASVAQASPGAQTRHRLAAAWRTPTPLTGEPADRVGVIEVDWEARIVRIAADHAAPGRAHGIEVLPDGGFVAVANRPGRWLLRCDASGQVARRIDTSGEVPQRSFNGHVLSDATGRWLYTTETDPRTGEGWISVRDASTLERVSEYPTLGLDPHQCLLAEDGSIFVANGGIPRDTAGEKIELHRMSPSLVRLRPGDGAAVGQWRLPDPRLSLRHIAWGRAPEASPTLGIAMQAEHDEAARRREAPTLAIWQDDQLRVATRDMQAAGYAGDITAGPGGGFVFSAQKAGRSLLWHPGRPTDLIRIAELTEPSPMAHWDDGSGGTGLLIGAARGVVRWHLRQPPQMLAWPGGLLPDNHWALLT